MRESSVLRVGFDGRDLLRKRTGVVNNAVYLARYLTQTGAALIGGSGVDAGALRQGHRASDAEDAMGAAGGFRVAGDGGAVQVSGDDAAAARAVAPQDDGVAERKGAELIVYVDRHVDEVPPEGVPLRTISAPAVVWKHVALPLALARDGVHVFHSPTGTLPLVAPCRQVVTVHDLFAAIEPGWFAPRVGRQLRVTQRRAARAADAVIAVSERTKTDLVERYGVPAERIRVVYNGVDHARFRPRRVDAEAVARRYGVPYPFILCVGSLMPWRNAALLLRATARLRAGAARQAGAAGRAATTRRGVGLLFVGRDIWGTDSTARLAAEQGWDWARFAGYVPDSELPELYAAAAAFAYPSLYEGFGIPPLEAMACGTPVVASTAGALPEVLGDAALLVDPTDEAALAEALEAALRDDGTLRRRGLSRAARFTWEAAAERAWRVYQAVAR